MKIILSLIAISILALAAGNTIRHAFKPLQTALTTR
jgi:hypothetical protein